MIDLQLFLEHHLLALYLGLGSAINFADHVRLLPLEGSSNFQEATINTHRIIANNNRPLLGIQVLEVDSSVTDGPGG